MASESQTTGRWTLLTNHAHVLLCVIAQADVRLRDVARQVGITERAAQRIMADLVAGGYLDRERVGRRNQYRVNTGAPPRHPLDTPQSVGRLLEVLVPRRPGG